MTDLLPTSCAAYVIKDRLGNEYMYFVWDMVEWDDYVVFDMTYYTASSTTETAQGFGPNVRAVSDYWSANVGSDYSTTIDTKYTSPIEDSTVTYSTTLSCHIYT